MNLDEAQKRFSAFFEECHELLGSKNHDYQPDGDAYAATEGLAEQLGVSVEMVFAVYMAKHWQSILTHAKSGELKSEKIRGRLIDLANYCALIAVWMEQSDGRCYGCRSTDCVGTWHQDVQPSVKSNPDTV